MSGQDGPFFLPGFLNFILLHKKCKKRTRPISSHLDRTSLVNKGFIKWPKRELFLVELTRNIPGGHWAGQAHLAHLGFQSEHTILFILPTHGFSNVIKMGTSKFNAGGKNPETSVGNFHSEIMCFDELVDLVELRNKMWL